MKNKNIEKLLKTGKMSISTNRYTLFVCFEDGYSIVNKGNSNESDFEIFERYENIKYFKKLKNALKFLENDINSYGEEG